MKSFLLMGNDIKSVGDVILTSFSYALRTFV